MRDYRYERDVAEMELGCAGCLVIGVTVPVVVIVTMWLVAHRHQIAGGGALALGALALYLARDRIASALRRKPKVDPTALPERLVDVAPGRVAHTAGLVMGAEKHTTPFGHEPSAYSRVLVERLDTPAVLLDVRSSDELLLGDGSGATILVPLAGTRWLEPRHLEVFSTPEEPDERLDGWLRDRGVVREGSARARIEWIEPHELVFVRGFVSAIAEGGEGYRDVERTRLEIRATPEHPVVLSLTPMPASVLRS